MTITATAPAPALARVTCQPWCDGIDHADGWSCMSSAEPIELSQHHYVDQRGKVHHDEAAASLRHDADSGRTLLEVEAAGSVTRMTLDEARQLHAAVSRLLEQVPAA